MIQVRLTHGAVTVTGHVAVKLTVRPEGASVWDRIADKLMPEFRSELELWAEQRSKR